MVVTGTTSGSPSGISVDKGCKKGDRCDARHAVLGVHRLTESTVSVELASGWEDILPQSGEDDPGFLVMWDFGNLQQTVTNINNAGGGGLAMPAWLAAAVPISVEGLMMAILNRVQGQVGEGGVVGNCAIAPNSLNGYGQLRDALNHLCFDPFFIGHAVCPLGRSYVLADRKHNTTAAAAPIVAPPANAVHLFH